MQKKQNNLQKKTSYYQIRQNFSNRSAYYYTHDTQQPAKTASAKEATIIRHKKRYTLCALILILGVLLATNFLGTRTAAKQAAQTCSVTLLKVRLEMTHHGSVPALVPVLMYHSVSEKPVGLESLSVRPSDFDEQMKYLSENGFTPISFDELERASNYKKPVLITFDDGYVDNYTQAYPILKKYEFHATIFMIAGVYGSPEFLTGDQMSAMSDLVSIQSHTVNHKKLAGMSEADLRTEMAESKRQLEEITGKSPTALSYPEGSYDKNVLKLAEEYYDYAVTTKKGYYYDGADRFQIRRFGICRNMPLKRFAQLVNAK